jgi:hypothetical protein
LAYEFDRLRFHLGDAKRTSTAGPTISISKAHYSAEDTINVAPPACPSKVGKNRDQAFAAPQAWLAGVLTRIAELSAHRLDDLLPGIGEPMPGPSMAVSALVVVVLFLATGEFEPRDPFGLLWALILTLYLGIAWGAYNALIAQLIHVWGYAFNLAFPLRWIGSGIVINVHGLPHGAGQYIAFNPLFQCIEYLRYSYYEGYPGDLLDVGYIFWFATCLLAVAFVLERLLRRQLLSA